MSSNRTVKFDGDWISTSEQAYLAQHGYVASTTSEDGVRTYRLHRVSREVRYPIIFETKDLDELNNMIKLLVPEN